MAVVFATLTGYLITETLKDVENDSNTAPYSTVNVRVESVAGGENSFITCYVPTSALSGINSNAPCTVIIQQ